jgi:hypothetical protein
VLKDIRGTIIDNTNENNDIKKEIIGIKDSINAS